MRPEPEASAPDVPGPVSEPKHPRSIPAAHGWARLGGLIVLVAATSFAVASVSPWLMIPYLALMAWLTLGPGPWNPESLVDPTRCIANRPTWTVPPIAAMTPNPGPRRLPSEGSNAVDPAALVEVATTPKRGRSGAVEPGARPRPRSRHESPGFALAPTSSSASRSFSPRPIG